MMQDPPRRVGRPRKAESFRRLVVAALAVEPELPTQELLKRATAEGYDGGKSAFYDMVAGTRLPLREASEPLPGERSRHDVVDVHVAWADGSRRRARIFVSRLPYSRWIAVSLLRSGADGVEPIARALVEHFVRAGGVPLLATFDSRRIDPARSDGPTELESALAHLALDLGVGIELPKPSRSRAGAADRLIRLVKDELAPQLPEVRDEDELSRAIEAWAERYNARSVDVSDASEASEASLEERLREERRRLRPLRVSLESLTLRVPIVVQAGGIVVHEGRKYKLAAEAAGASGMLHLTSEQLRIVAGSVTGIFTR